MKKALTLLGALFIFLGVKSQTAPAVKKETVKPGAVQPAIVSDTVKKIALKQNPNMHKATVQMKQNPLQMKETPVKMKESPTAKPHKD
jgi:hypothetical protein